MDENCFEALFHLFKWDTAVILIVDKKKITIIRDFYDDLLHCLYRTMYI